MYIQKLITKDFELTILLCIQMDITPLSHVHPGVYNYIICVRVSRMWEFHGKNDDEAIKHLDLVLIDQKVSSIAIFQKRIKTNIQQFSDQRKFLFASGLYQ